MSIGNIVCRGGVGPTATIGLFVTHGLGVGGTPVPTPITGGHFLPEEHRQHLKRQNQILAAREEEKLVARQLLRKQVESGFRGEEDIPSSDVPKKPQKKTKPVQNPERLRDPRLQLEELEAELHLLRQEMILNVMEMRRLREEDDIRAILLALEAPFHEFSSNGKIIQ